MRLRGLVFDFNGVIVNDEPLHCRGFQQALSSGRFELGLEEYFEKYMPYDDFHFFLHFFADRGVKVDERTIRELMKLKSERYFQLVSEEIPALPGSVSFIRSLPPDVPVVIASGAARGEIEFILDRLQLLDRFQGIVAAGDVTKSKPHPEAFLKAFATLQQVVDKLQPGEVVAFEDSYRGVEAARSAGLRCVALTTAYSAARLEEADLVLDSLDGWTLERLASALEYTGQR